jgi:hypothetical protein
MFGLPSRLPARLAGDLAWRHGHERALIGRHLFDEIEQLGPRIALDVVLDAGMAAYRPGDRPDIVGRDVAAIGARMHGDARSTGRDADLNGFDHVRLAPAARVAKCSHFIHVD